MSYLDYPANLKEYYQKLAHLPGFVLLESTDSSRGRYDILSAYPYEEFIVECSTTDLTAVFERLQQWLPQKLSAVNLPFQGGAIGYFSYDLAVKLAKITTNHQVVLHNMPLVALGLYDWAIITDHVLQKVILFAANLRADTMTIVEEIKALWHSPVSKKNSFHWTGHFLPALNYKAYQESFNAIYQVIEQGRCYQVNYTQPFTADYQGDPWLLYRQISQTNRVPYAAFLRRPQGDILSFSPERFLMFDKARLLASPIKGTAKRKTDSSEDWQSVQQLLACGKNRAENVMIVDLWRHDLGQVAKPGTVRVLALCELESYQSVHHLVSHIEADCLDHVSPLQALQTCFPAGSITGAPKLEAMRVIAEQEPYTRGVYCGNIGYFSYHGRFDFNIAIRTLVAQNKTLHLAAGGGIVIDSLCTEEYEECLNKIAGISALIYR